MDGAGFHVELDVLEQAARRMQDIVTDQDGRGLCDVCGGMDQYGHAGVHAELAEFCNAWSAGMDTLRDRTQSMAGELRVFQRRSEAAHATGQALHNNRYRAGALAASSRTSPHGRLASPGAAPLPACPLILPN